MKKIIFVLTVLLTGATLSYAQCDKKLLLTSSKTEYLSTSGNVERTVEENSIIQISRSELVITPGGEENKMSGPVKSVICNWKTPFKEGKSIIKAALTDGRGDVKNVTITIEGKDGLLTLLAEVDEMPDKRIKVVIDKFEEKN